MKKSSKHKKLFDYDPLATDVKTIQNLGVVCDDACDFIIKAPLRLDSPFTRQALTYLKLRQQDLQPRSHIDFVIEKETREQTEARYQLHLCQVAGIQHFWTVEHKKLLIKERNRLKKEQTKSSVVPAAQKPNSSAHLSVQLDYKNYLANRLDDQIALIKDNNAKENQRAKAEFLATLEQELEAQEKIVQLESQTARAIQAKEKTLKDRQQKLHRVNKHVASVREAQKKKLKLFYRQMELRRRSLSEEDLLINQMIQEKRRLRLESMSNDQEQQKAEQFKHRRDQQMQEQSVKEEKLHKKLDKKLELSTLISRQAITERQRKTTTFLQRVNQVRTKQQEKEYEEELKRIYNIVEKQEKIENKTPPKTVKSQLKGRFDKLKKNLKQIKQEELKQREQLRIKYEAKLEQANKFTESKEQLRVDKLSSTKDKFMQSLTRFEKLNQEYKEKCDKILEKERYDHEIIFQLTQKKNLMREDTIQNVQYERARSRMEQQKILEQFHEKPNRKMLIRSLTKFDVKNDRLVDKYFPLKQSQAQN